MRDYWDSMPGFFKPFIIVIVVFFFVALAVSANIIVAIVLFILFVGALFLIEHLIRQRNGFGGGNMPRGRGDMSPQLPGPKAARKFIQEGVGSEARDNVTRFSDVAGCEEAKEELQEIVDFLKDPSDFERVGARVPRGVLLIGSPGCGKTLLARAVAGEANATFIPIRGSDFVEMYVGVGASRVRTLFQNARAKAPAIIFIDEIDAVGRQRGAGLGQGNDEREQTLNALLAEMDGFKSTQNVVVLAATNRPDILDPALLRPGRFDRKTTVGLPDFEDRVRLLEVHTQSYPPKPLDGSVNLNSIARKTSGFSGADLANVANEAAIFAARRKASIITQGDFEEAIDKVMLGPARKHKMSDEERRLTAYHEAGHAVVAAFHPHADMPRKITILPRGMTGGHTQMDTEDRMTLSREQIEAQLAYLYGGRVAEDIFIGTISTGAADDIKKATILARRFVAEYGMSEKVGPINVSVEEHDPFLGRTIAQPKGISDKTAEIIDSEVVILVKKAQEVALQSLEDNKEKVEALVAALLEQETLEAEDINKILGLENSS